MVLGADHEWKNRFFRTCLTPILSAVVAVQLPEYTHIIALDRLVRDFYVPVLLDEHQPYVAIPRFLVMQRGLVTMSRAIGQYLTPLTRIHAVMILLYV